MEEIGIEGRTLKAAIDKACEELSVGQNALRYRLDVSHFRDENGKARGVDTVRIIAWAEVGSEVVEEPSVNSRPVDNAAQSSSKAPPEVVEDAPVEGAMVVSSSVGETNGAAESSGEQEPSDSPVQEASEVVREFVVGALTKIGMSADVSANQGSERIEVSLDNLSSGKVGENRVSKVLKSVEYLANRLSTSDQNRLPRVSMSLDGEDDRGPSEKERHLQAVAAKVVAQVRKDDRPLTLKPMNSYERRIIHLAVSGHEGVGSRSIGEGQRKRVQVFPMGEDS